MRAYKGFTPRMGLYRVRHLPSGRTLLGCSPHVEGMLNRIRFQLEIGQSPWADLKRDWQADGPDAFAFEVLDELSPNPSGADPTADLEALLDLWQAQLALPPEQVYRLKRSV